MNLTYFDAVIEALRTRCGARRRGRATAVSARRGSALPDIAQTADILVNISGHLTDAHVLKPRFRCRIFIDLIPATRSSGMLPDSQRIGSAITISTSASARTSGNPSAACLPGNVAWRRIRQPVVLTEWPVVASTALPPRFTTVASWRGPLGRVTRERTTYGVKAQEFRKFMPLPTLSGHSFEIALEADPADQSDLDALHRNGWRVVDPKGVVPDPPTFRR